jgi:hypothetical protein
MAAATLHATVRQDARAPVKTRYLQPVKYAWMV